MRKLALWVGSLLLCTATLASDWPQFRGPNQNGIASGDGVFSKKAFGLKVDWKKDLGSGYSGVTVVGDIAVTMFSNETEDLMAAFNTANGEELWRYSFGPVYKGHSGSQDGPTGTPTVHDGIVYALDTHGVFVALELKTGNKLWGYHLGKDIQARVPHYGFNTVPLIIDDRLILMTGDEKNHTFTAFDRKSGKQLWHSGNDTSTYQSPMLKMHGNQKRILAVTDHKLMELDPSNGQMLWEQEHNTLDNESYALPVFMGEDRVLIQNRRGVAGFSIEWNDGKAELKELWRNESFLRTYAIPVYKDGYVYGFKANFLSCLDAQTGETVWRSRPPGGRAITLLDGHLVIIGNDGSLVVAEATHEGYREKARTQVFDRGSYSAAAFADGALYVRNLKEIARVSITDTQTNASIEKKPEVQLLGEFGKFVAQLEKSSNKKKDLDAFWHKQKSFPIVEKGGLVHFVYRGTEKDVAVARGFDEEKPMHHVAGTDLFFFSEKLDEDSHWEYHFSVFGDFKADPMNPLRVGTDPRARHELRMPGWEVPEYLSKPSGPKGSVVETEIQSKIRNKAQKARVYLPHGYEQSKQRYPLLIVNNGDGALDIGQMNTSLDHLIAHGQKPVIVAFIQGDREELMGEHQNAYANMVINELIPHLDATYRTDPNPASRGVMGSGRGAVIATHMAFMKPHAFGKLANQSFVFLNNTKETTQKMISQAGPNKPAVFLELSSNDYKFPGFDAEASTEELANKLNDLGYSITVHKTASSPGWASWRGRTGQILEWFTKE